MDVVAVGGLSVDICRDLSGGCHGHIAKAKSWLPQLPIALPMFLLGGLATATLPTTTILAAMACTPRDEIS